LKNSTIGEYFSALTAIELEAEELVQSLICKKCLKDLKFSYQFRQKCLENHGEFQRLLRDPLVPVEEEEEQSDPAVDPPVPEPKPEKRKKRLDCRFCGLLFKSRTLCSKHENDTHIRKESAPSACSYCGKVFPRRINCMIHEINVHKKEKKFECHFCQKRFFRKYDLAEHLNIHIGVRPAVCDFPGCTKSFFRKIHLTQHKKNIHNGSEGEFLCQNHFKVPQNHPKYLKIIQSTSKSSQKSI
jgi:uncharacterized Zn-finger protein